MTTWDTPPTGTWGHFAWRRQNLLAEIAAAGVVVTFVILLPSYKYLVTNPYSGE